MSKSGDWILETVTSLYLHTMKASCKWLLSRARTTFFPFLKTSISNIGMATRCAPYPRLLTIALTKFPQFELIQKLDGHHGEIWAIAAGRNGNFVVTGSHDKSIRVWEKTDEPLFLEEERERELEKLYEGDIANNLNREDGAIGSGIDGGAQDSISGPEVTTVQKHSTETLMAGEKIMEALELADAEREGERKYAEIVGRLPESEKGKVGPPARNAVLAALDLSPQAYVLQTLERVRASALYDSLLVLPFSKVASLFYYMDLWASQVRNLSAPSCDC